MLEWLGTIFVDLLLLFFLVVGGVAAFFMFLNSRDARIDEKLYDPEFSPDAGVQKAIFRGRSEDDGIDPASALKAYAQKPDEDN